MEEWSNIVSGAKELHGRASRLRVTTAIGLLLGTLLVLAPGCGHTILESSTILDRSADDHGPGTYVYPSGEPYRPGALDLRAVSLRTTQKHLEVRVTFARRVPVLRQVRVSRDVRADLFLPTVDVYLDLGPGGSRAGLPGRGIVFRPRESWNVALVLTAIPGRLRTTIRATGSVFFTRDIRIRGRTLIGTYPRDVLGGRTLASAGVGVAVMGTVFQTTFRAKVRGQLRTAFIREITARSGRCGPWEEAPDGAPCTFGGCGPCGQHPRVIDALTPVPGRQERDLSTYLRSGKRAILPMTYARARSPRRVMKARSSRWRVVARRSGALTAEPEREGRGARCTPGMLGDALAADGSRLGVVALVVRAAGARVIFRMVEGSAARVVALQMPCAR